MSGKVSGFLPVPPKTDIDGKLGDLNTLTIHEIRELLERQRRIQNNKLFISKLPDKGAKITAVTEKLEDKLKLKEQEEKARDMLEKLSLNSHPWNSLDQDTVQSVEWKGKEIKKNTYLDSDDDSEPDNLIGVLTQKTMHERKVRVIKLEPSLKKSNSLSDNISPEQLSHVKYILGKTENNAQKMTTPFKPYKTTKSDVHNPSKERFRKCHKNWEVTAATPPLIKHEPVKVLSIEESIRLQTEQNKKLKEVETQHASQRLKTTFSAIIGENPKSLLASQQYREVVSDDQASDNELTVGSDNEVYDEEPDKGGIVYTVMM